MKKYFGILLLCATVAPANAQRVLSLDSCRQMALRNNKQLGVSKLKQDVAENLRKSARTKYLPHVSALGTYEHTSKEVRSRIMISSPLIIVNPATQTINARIIHTLISNSSSQINTCG